MLTNVPQTVTALREYPYNLFDAITDGTDLTPPPSITMDIRIGISYAISTLGEMEQEILRLRFEENTDYPSIGTFFDMPAECVQQIEKRAMSKLRVPHRWNYMRLGINGNMKIISRKSYNRGYNRGYCAGYKKGIANNSNGENKNSFPVEVLHLPIETMNLSARAYNCLFRAGLSDIEDVIQLTEDEIVRMRSMGKKTAFEIAKAVKRLNIELTAWDAFLV